MEHKPIFIGGLSFTGKTQLRLMLSAHPNIHISRLTHLWDRFYNRYGDLSSPVNLQRCLKAMLGSKAIQALNPDIDRLALEFARGPATYEHLFACLHAQYAESQGKSRWGDQMTSIGHYASRIFSAYPAARMIHMIRHPAARFAESRSNSPHRLGHLGWETAHWLSSARLARRNQELFPGRYLVVSYENLFDHPEAAMQQICDFLGEFFYPEMLIHGAIEAHAAAGRQFPPSRDLHFICSYTRQAMQESGYDHDDWRLSPGDWLQYWLTLPFNRAALLAGSLEAAPDNLAY